MARQCECQDLSCPVHEGGDCGRTATEVLYCMTYDDLRGTWFCPACAEEAMQSGAFTTARSTQYPSYGY